MIGTDGVVTLRASTPDDAAVLVAGRDAEFARFLGEGASDDPRPYAVIVVDGAVVGWVDWDADRAWLGPGEVNLGYHVFAEHRGRGHATRAVALLLRHLAGRATTATLLIDPANTRSLALAARAGFERRPDLDGQAYFIRAVHNRGVPLAKVITVSDGVVAGTREDRSGAVAAEVLAAAGFEVVERRVVADGVESVAAALTEATAGFAGVVVTTGGTGFGPRDLTPEGTKQVLERDAPGLAEAMRLVSPLGRLSRQVAGTVGTALVVNLPGSSNGVRECLDAVLDVVPHALDLLAGGRPH